MSSCWGPRVNVFVYLMNTISFVFVMESLRSWKLVPFIPYFYLSIILFFILSFSHLPVRPVGCNLKSLGVTREAQLLVTVDRDGVWSVGIFKAKLRKIIKGTDYLFVRVERCLPYDSKQKERWYRTSVEPPTDSGRKCSGQGNCKTEFLREETM